MTAPDLMRTGCRVLDKDGDDETEAFSYTTGCAEWRAVRRAQYLARILPEYGPFRVVDADGVTLHTIHATREGE